MPATSVTVAGAEGAASTTASTSASSPPSALPALRPQGMPFSPRGIGHFRPMASTRNFTSNVDVERKRRFVRRVPILKQLVREQHCTEEQLTAALRATSFVDGEYVYCQGQAEKDLYFIEDGKVLLTQRRQPGGAQGGTIMGVIASALAAPSMPMPTRRRSVQDAELEVQIHTHHENEYFGELALLQNKAARECNAVASGAVVCFILGERDFDTLLRPLHSLMLYRYLLRAHGVLEKERMFKEWTPAQRQHLINQCYLQSFSDGEQICQQGEISDKYYVLVEGEADVVVEEATLASILAEVSPSIISSTLSSRHVEVSEELDESGAKASSTVVARKSIFQGFGEMGLLGKPRTAGVIAIGADVLCVVITRQHYISAAQLGGTSSAIDVDAEALLATTLMEEWKLVINARNLHLSNPQVAHYLVTFIKHFKAAYNQKFAGKTMYLDFFRRLHQQPELTDEFDFVAKRIAWDSPLSSLGIIRSETRRVLTKPSASRTPDEVSFIGRLIEHTPFIGKFDLPGPHVDRYRLARSLARVVAFSNIGKDVYLFRQGKIESRAFLILRGKINIVNEDTNASTAIKHHEVIATLSAGDSFGELSLVTRLQRSATTMAACDTDLLVFDREHLHAVQAALPGVSVQQLMVKRAEFLSRLSFFRGSDFGQCIRVAHDVQEAVYDVRHLFLQESVHQRTLYIVKSGEIGVFMKIHVPLTTQGQPPATSSGATSPRDKPSAGARSALVRVATIGEQEFFGVAIANVNTGGPTPPAGASTTTATTTTTAVASTAVLQANGEQWDVGSTVYMSTTRVEMLELSERGWRRLSPQCLVTIRNALRERHKWNEATASKQQQRAVSDSTSTSGVSTAYYQIEKPWQQLVLHTVGMGPAGESSHLSVPAGGGRPHSQLARHVHEKQTFASPFAKLFPPTEPHAATPGSDSPSRKVSERRASTCVSSTTAMADKLTTSMAAWGWRSPFDATPPRFSSAATPTLASGSVMKPSQALSPLVSFTDANVGITPRSAALSLSLQPRPPPGDRQALLAIANLSPRSPVRPAVTTTGEIDGSSANRLVGSTTGMWQARSPLVRRTEHHAP